METRKERFRFRFPTKLNLLGQEWKIITTSDALYNDGKLCAGLTIPTEKTIKITTSSKYDPIFILCHELSHSGAFLFLQNAVINYDDELFANTNAHFWKNIIEAILEASFEDKPKITKEDLIKDLEEIQNNANKQIKKLKGGK